jgi:hypothetical protein
VLAGTIFWRRCEARLRGKRGTSSARETAADNVAQHSTARVDGGGGRDLFAAATGRNTLLQGRTGVQHDEETATGPVGGRRRYPAGTRVTRPPDETTPACPSLGEAMRARDRKLPQASRPPKRPQIHSYAFHLKSLVIVPPTQSIASKPDETAPRRGMPKCSPPDLTPPMLQLHSSDPPLSSSAACRGRRRPTRRHVSGCSQRCRCTRSGIKSRTLRLCFTCGDKVLTGVGRPESNTHGSSPRLLHTHTHVRAIAVAVSFMYEAAH